MDVWWKTSMLNDWLLLETSFKNAAVEKKRSRYTGSKTHTQHDPSGLHSKSLYFIHTEVLRQVEVSPFRQPLGEVGFYFLQGEPHKSSPIR